MSSINIPFEYFKEKNGGYSILTRTPDDIFNFATCADKFEDIPEWTKDAMLLNLKDKDLDIAKLEAYDGTLKKSDYKGGNLFYTIINTKTRKVEGFEGLENEVIKTKVAKVTQSK